MGVCEPPEVTLAPPPGPLCKYRQGENFCVREPGGAAGSRGRGCLLRFPPVVDETVERDEQVFEVHATPPSGRGFRGGGGMYRKRKGSACSSMNLALPLSSLAVACNLQSPPRATLRRPADALHPNAVRPPARRSAILPHPG